MSANIELEAVVLLPGSCLTSESQPLDTAEYATSNLCSSSDNERISENPHPHTSTHDFDVMSSVSVFSASGGTRPKQGTYHVGLPSMPLAGKFSIKNSSTSGSRRDQSSIRISNSQPNYVVSDTALRRIHASAIGHRSRVLLSLHMNPTKTLGNDWRALADYMGFSMLEIHHFELDRDPTTKIMKEWTTKRDSTIGDLIKMISDCEREDVLAALEKTLKIDAQNWKRRNSCGSTGEDSCRPPVQVAEVSGTSYPNVPVCPELRGITLNDKPDGPIETFDAYVCHNPDTDYQFVLEMIAAMEKPPYQLRFCTDWRDLVPGGSYATATAELIENRCKRMIVVLSPEFLSSGYCDFQAKFALSLSPGARSKRMVPIMVEPCTPPAILRHITSCDYTKEALRVYFWPRLYTALDLN